MVEPGSYRSVIARLRTSASNCWSFRFTADSLMPGCDAMARTAPVRGFMTMIEPLLAPYFPIALASAFSVIACMKRSIVNCTSPPSTAGRSLRLLKAIGRPSASRSVVSQPSLPRSMLSKSASTPQRPAPSRPTYPTSCPARSPSGYRRTEERNRRIPQRSNLSSFRPSSYERLRCTSTSPAGCAKPSASSWPGSRVRNVPRPMAACCALPWSRHWKRSM